MNDERVRYQSIVWDSARWDGFEFRPDDIVISTPAKCGTTWTQMICALLVFQTPDLPASIDALSPWVDMLIRRKEDVFAQLEAQTHRRFIKTHTPRDGIPWDPRVTYIVVGRDPRDVGCSWDNHQQNANLEALFAARDEAVGNDDILEIVEMITSGEARPQTTEAERFWAWVDDPTPITSSSGLNALCHHLSTWWPMRDEPNVVLLHYSDLKCDLEGEMRRVAERLALSVPEEQWPDLVKAATFESMRANTEITTPERTHGIWQDDQRFFHRGTSGQWRNVIEDDELPRYFARIDELASPELSAWLHH